MSSSVHTQLFGPTLTTKDGDVSTDTALAGVKYIGLYFSAHWCPPCRGFTPELVKAYKDHLKAKGLEIIFVSSDRDDKAFQEYYAEMPWLAAPYADRSLKAKLSKKYKVQGIPTFVMLDGATCDTITTDARSDVSQDPQGANFPWKPPTFFEALGNEFLSGVEGETVEVDSLKGEGKYIGLYFSAHWCPPCRGFTPELVKAYKDHLKAKGLEIIFVSSDRDDKSFQEYYATMPWLAIPNGDKRKGSLSKMFDVQGIPSFVIVDASTGATVSKSARGSVSKDPTGSAFPWPPKPLVNISEEDPEGINEETCVCALLEGCDKPAAEKAVAALTPIAAAAKKAGEPMLFFYADDADGPAEQIRRLTKLGEPKAGVARLVILDIPDEGGFYVSDATELTAEAVVKMIDGYKAGALERKQLGS